MRMRLWYNCRRLGAHEGLTGKSGANPARSRHCEMRVCRFDKPLGVSRGR